MPQASDLDFIDLSDFTPGIHSDFHSAGGPQSAPDGAAQKDGTWGCIAAPTGGLVPTPAVEFTRDMRITIATDEIINPDGSSNLTGNRMPEGHRYIAILDVLNFPGIRAPLYRKNSGGVTQNDPQLGTHDTGIHDYFTAVTQMFWDYSGGFDAWVSMKAIYHDYLFLTAASSLTDGEARPLIPWWGSVTIGETGPFNVFQYGFGAIELGRAYGVFDSDTSGLFPGQPHFKISIGSWLDFQEENGGTGYRGVYIYPGDNNYLPDRLRDGGGTEMEVSSPFVIGHQGRTVWSDVGSFQGLDTLSDDIEGAQWVLDAGQGAALQTADTLYWTKPNQLAPDNLDGSVFVEENPTGFGAHASMNASELLLVKNVGGGMVIRGSLNNPTIVRLPGIESTFGVVNKAVVTPLGCIYGARSGVWVWNGSDTSTCLSSKLDGWFFETPGTDDYHPSQIKGRFAYHHPFVFAPNSWVLDVRTGGWFRWNNPDDEVSLDFWNVGVQGRVYGTPAVLPVDQDDTGVQSLPYLYAHKLDTFRSDWSWTSQPLQKTRNRKLQFREVDLVASGHGTITVTLTGLNGATESIEFSVDSDQPVAMSDKAALGAHDVVVTIAAAAADPGDPAPRLYRLALGHRVEQGTTPTGSVA